MPSQTKGFTLPETMAAAVVTGHGGLEKLEIRRVQVPAAGPGDVLVRVKACALNNTDIWFREGAYGTIEDPGAVTGPQRRPGEFPRVPGADVAGEIVAVGEGVSPRQLGKAVVLFFFQSPGPLREEHMAESMTILGSDHDGGYAEYVCWPSDLCFPLPFDDFERSAALTLAGLTAWNMIERARIAQGEKVLVTGATGGVGSLAVQIAARVFGATVIAVARDTALTSELEGLGASAVVSYRSETLGADIWKAAGSPVDAVLDVVGQALLNTALASLRAGGRLVTSGASGGPLATLDFRTLYAKHLTLAGCSLGTRLQFKRLLEAARQGAVVPVIDRVFPLVEAREAQAYFKESKKLGKVLLAPSQP